MALKTIQCRLTANSATRRHLWTLMAEKNTPLINELIQQIIRHPDFESFRQDGKISSKIVSELCESLKTEPRFQGQPSRLYMSAEHVADYIFKSWLAIQKRLQHQLDRKQGWLDVLKSDDELLMLSNLSIEKLRAKAEQILKTAQTKHKESQGNKSRSSTSKKKKRKSDSENLFSQLFGSYSRSKNIQKRCAIAYLLKNKCSISTTDEDIDQYNLRRRKAELRVKRLRDQLNLRLPKGRDLTGQNWLNVLKESIESVPVDNTQFKHWQAQLLKKPLTIPFPVAFETNEDLVWTRNENGRICVHFNGLSDYTFQVYCDQRQLHWFERFLEDQTVKSEGKNQHTSALFALRSGRVAWQEGNEKGAPWEVHHLVLSCTIETRLWSKEGTEQVRKEKAIKIEKSLKNMAEKREEVNLSDSQENYVKRLESTKRKLEVPYNRPNRSTYNGQPHIIAGISLAVERPVTLTIWDAKQQKVLTYRSTRQLLDTNHPLLNRYRQQQNATAHERHKAQKQSKGNQFGPSNLGLHINRLFAKAVIEIAQEYRAGSIAIPKLKGLRDVLNAEIQAKAEQKIPGYIEGQKRYAKQYRQSIHR